MIRRAFTAIAENGIGPYTKWVILFGIMLAAAIYWKLFGIILAVGLIAAFFVSGVNEINKIRSAYNRMRK